jgi:hypothetical protein
MRHARPLKTRPNALFTSTPSSTFQVPMAHFLSMANLLSAKMLPMPAVCTLHSRLGRSARRRSQAWVYQVLSFSPMNNYSSSIMQIGGAERAPRRLLLNASTLTHMHRNGHVSWALWPTRQSLRKLSIVRQRSRLANCGELVNSQLSSMAALIDLTQRSKGFSPVLHYQCGIYLCCTFELGTSLWSFTPKV